MFYISYTREEQIILRSSPLNYYIVYSLLKEKVDFNTGLTTEQFSTKNSSIVKSLEKEGVHLTRNQVLKIIIQLEKLNLIKRETTVGIYRLPFSHILPKSKAPPKAQPQAPQKPIQDKDECAVEGDTLHQSMHQNEEQGIAQTTVDIEVQPSEIIPSVQVSVSNQYQTHMALSEKALNESWLEYFETLSPLFTDNEIALEKEGFYLNNELLLAIESTIEPKAQPNAETEGFSAFEDKSFQKHSLPATEILPLKTEPKNEGSKITAFEGLILKSNMFNYPSNKISRGQYQLWEKSGITEQQVLNAIEQIKAKGVISTTPDKLTTVLNGMSKRRQMTGANSRGLVL